MIVAEPEQLIKSVSLYAGDCLAVLASLDADSVDSCVTDPPYHLQSIHKRFAAKGCDETSERYAAGPYGRTAKGFMGKQWDGGDVAFRVELWREVFRVLKPGAHLVAFSGTRTYHRMACAIEDAGFEIRDQIGWAYGSGFPKSHDVSKGIDRAAGAQRKVLAQGAQVKRMIPGADQHKNGRKKDNGREFVPCETAPATDAAVQWQGWGTALKPAWEPICLARKPLIGTVAENVLAHGTGAINIDGCRVSTSDAITPFGSPMESVGGIMNGTAQPREQFKQSSKGRWPANIVHDGSDEVVAAFPQSDGQQGALRGTEPSGTFSKVSAGPLQRLAFEPRNDSGSAARFFYTSKADSDDRLGSKHPTVKPLDLMQWLVRLVTPPNGLVLDPFAGTGTTGEAAWREGMRAVLIEREAEYQNDIRRRMALALAGPDERQREALKARGLADENPGPLFAGATA